jgi:bifunctional DNA-binding transcriptional regulator/antitoxin component of YhaV-PrlF toxin-antitoxin module
MAYGDFSMPCEFVSMPKKLDKSGRIYLTALDREATGAEPGDILQVSVRVIKKGSLPAELVDDAPEVQA